MPFSSMCLLLFALLPRPSSAGATPVPFSWGRFAISSSSAQADRGFAEKITIPGIRDAAKVNDYLFRGSQLEQEGLDELKKLGITTIIDLRGELRGAAQAEREQAEALGMRVVIIPASGWSPPTDEQMVQFFQLVQKQKREKVYLHCWLGDDRTGVFIGAYRIAFQHWSADDALREMDYFHFKGSWHRSMKTYIRDFPAHFAATPAFAPFR